MPADRLHFEAFGSTCELFGDNLNQVHAWLEEMQRRLTRFSPGSDLSGLNRAAGAWVEVGAELEALLRASLVAFEISGGLVNAAVLNSMSAIGYTRTFSEGPGPVTLEAAEPVPPLPDVLSLRPGRARLRPGAGVDLGGLAKGWLADRAAERLGPRSLANLGGDLFARGRWPVGMAGKTLLLEGQGAATSGTWRRRWGHAHHLIDPRTGLPATTDLVQVSVVAESGFVAEVHAKTALLLGANDAPAYLAARCPAWALA
jgi:thiamine biosynthesis lipoprotein